jgi:hypothetical protein
MKYQVPEYLTQPRKPIDWVAANKMWYELTDGKVGKK